MRNVTRALVAAVLCLALTAMSVPNANASILMGPAGVAPEILGLPAGGWIVWGVLLVGYVVYVIYFVDDNEDVPTQSSGGGGGGAG